ncbi:MAG: hypothetical protein LBR53_06405 [Deltaproteobacteria bacterium]|jgi:hypothetical protein|nr:hypothetical protein [Deltaproteobacteria bacterium]
MKGAQGEKEIEKSMTSSVFSKFGKQPFKKAAKGREPGFYRAGIGRRAGLGRSVKGGNVFGVAT